MQMKQNSVVDVTKSGFSLIEIMVTVAVIAIVVGMVVPITKSQREFTNISKTNFVYQTISDGLTAYYLSKGHFPYHIRNRSVNCGDEGLAALVCKPKNDSLWDGPYTNSTLKGVTSDAWGKRIHYGIHASTSAFGCNEFTHDSCVLITKRELTRSFGGNLTAVLESGGPNNRTNEDNLTFYVHSKPLEERLREKTYPMLSAIRRDLFDQERKNPKLFEELDDIVDLKFLGTCSVDHPDRKKEITYLIKSNTPSKLKDSWGSYYLWHDQTNQFYSPGPDKLDQTCLSSTISDSDIVLQ